MERRSSVSGSGAGAAIWTPSQPGPLSSSQALAGSQSLAPSATQVTQALSQATVADDYGAYTQTDGLATAQPLCCLRLMAETGIPQHELVRLEAAHLTQLEVVDCQRASRVIEFKRDTFHNAFLRPKMSKEWLRMSRIHATIEVQQEGTNLTVWLKDGSLNGTFLNGRRVSKNARVQLHDGDWVCIITRQDVASKLSSSNGAPPSASASGASRPPAEVATPNDSATNAADADRRRPVLAITKDDVWLGYNVSNLLEKASDMLPATQLADSEEAPAAPGLQRYPRLCMLFSAPLVFRDSTGNPRPMTQVDYAAEFKVISQALRDGYSAIPDEASKDADDTTPASAGLVKHPSPIMIEQAFATTDCFRTILTKGCTALHFTGHGTNLSLLFENGFGCAHTVTTKVLQDLFAAGGTTGVQLVVVSACSSAPLGRAFVDVGVPHVIAVMGGQNVQDVAAKQFTRSFYTSLAAGKTIHASFHIAKQGVRASPEVAAAEEEAKKFVLLPETGNHHVPIFPCIYVRSTAAAPSLPALPNLFPDSLPSTPQHFIGRNVDIFEVLCSLLRRRLVTIAGPKGVGKSAVAGAVCSYASQRRMFPGGVYSIIVPKTVPALEAHIRETLKECKVADTDRGGILLWLDGCDRICNTQAAVRQFFGLLATWLGDFPGLKILMTAVKDLHSLQVGESDTQDSNSPTFALVDVERVHTLAGLQADDAARLLVKASATPLTMDDVAFILGPSAADTGYGDVLKALAGHPFIASFEGLPGSILAAAARLASCTLQQLAAERLSAPPSAGAGAAAGASSVQTADVDAVPVRDEDDDDSAAVPVQRVAKRRAIGNSDGVPVPVAVAVGDGTNGSSSGSRITHSRTT